MRKGFVDILLLLIILFGLPIYIMITIAQDHFDEINKHIQSGGGILCTQYDSNGTIIKSIKITDYTNWTLTEKNIENDGVMLNLMKCEKVIEINGVE